MEKKPMECIECLTSRLDTVLGGITRSPYKLTGSGFLFSFIFKMCNHIILSHNQMLAYFVSDVDTQYVFLFLFFFFLILYYLKQWFSTFWPFKYSSSCCDPTIKLFSLLLNNCNVATVMNRNVNI
uniref:Uncharacterized protein n=1 Tax=Myotis myotis TaxID=51298 RepID=A0A7J7ZXP7_MYOMY|nr:hypothetical protein mMyoMyo1_009931 [Myotis myotis]